MKLDRRHMIGSVALLVASIIYNVWIFTRPATGARPASFPVGAPSTPTADGPSAAAGIDPTQVQELPDVALDRPPQWGRDPFGGTRAVAAEAVADVVGTVPEVVPDPDPVVASILYSSDRRAAVISGRVVRIGDMVGTSLVVDILPRSVVIESPDRERRTLALKAPTARGGQP